MTFRLSLIALGLAGWLTATACAADDVEVLARGPVHEAYAEPSEREPKPTPVIAKEPPKPIEELPPDQKPEGDNVQWMPGYWQWDEERKDFLWVSGFWRNAPPDRMWVPGSWRKAADGWQWTGGFWSATKENKAQVEYLPQPPAPLDDAGPTTPAPSADHVYVPGSWVYRERYVWRPGYYTDHRPGWVWCAAHYRWTPAGYLFIDGYWDYPLADRGVLFAPVYIPEAVYAAPSFVYTPSYVVQETALFGAFFCRRGFGSYYFGDYFAPSYASLGFSAWCGNVGISFGVGRGWYDPLFSYYSCGFRSDPFWGGGGIHNLYAGRYRGDYLRPPVNLVQQNTVINNITQNSTINNVNVNNVTMVNSLNNVARAGRRPFQTVGESTRRQLGQSAQGVREVGARRGALESDLAARPGAGGRTAPVRTGALDVPRPLTGPKAPAPKATGAKIDPVAPPPPRPAPTRVGAPMPKLTGPGRTDPPTGVGNPKLDPRPGPGTGTAGPRPNLKPPVAPKGGPATRPNVTPPSPAVEPKGPLPKSPAPKADLPRPNPVSPPKGSPAIPPKVNPVVPKAAPVVPKANPGAPPKLNPTAPPRISPVAPPVARPPANVPAPRPVLPPAAKPAAPRPPVSVPKPPSIPAAPRAAPQPVIPRPTARPAAPAPRPTPRLGPASSPTPRPAAPSRPAPGPRKGKG